MVKIIPTVVTSKLDYIDFWSMVAPKIILPADIALPDISIVYKPRTAIDVYDILMIKYSTKKDTSGADNQITAGKITSKEPIAGAYVDALYLINGEAAVAADTKEGGDVHVSPVDICGNSTDSGIFGLCDVQSVFSGVTTTGASLELYDVQVGLRIYFI